jgi:polyribonucleotide nucleotidyltransferase
VRAVTQAFRAVCDEVLRELIVQGKRVDGRRPDDIRPIACEVGVLPRAHGSALFTRGETQALVAATLGSGLDEQVIDGLQDEYKKRFMLHYNFPPYSVGEVRPIRGTSRRELGHGDLAERSLEPVLPDEQSFPYTLRLVSEILMSNGSSSMASVCCGSLAMLDAGVKTKAPVAGIAMGLVKEGDRVVVLSDILGDEDHAGDMDFKVAGTAKGITAVQMDIKVTGVSEDVLRRALDQAKQGRLHILREMIAALPRPREQYNQYAPRVEVVQINPEKIGALIGPGGKNIKRIVEESGCEINIEDDGTVNIYSTSAEGMEVARREVEGMTAEAEVGKIYRGKVVTIKEFGCFVEFLPGKDGLCHISELANFRVKQTEDIVKMGDEIWVKCLGIDEKGRVKLSRKAAMAERDKEAGDKEAEPAGKH